MGISRASAYAAIADESFPVQTIRVGRPGRLKVLTASLIAVLEGGSGQLELTAHHLGWRSLAERIAAAAPGRPWQTRWSRGRRATGHQVLTGHTGWVCAVAVGALPDGTPVILSGDVRVWRLADGTPVGQPLPHPAARCARWRWGGCRTAPRSSSAAATTARCGCAGWLTAPRSYLRWTYPNRYMMSPFAAASSLPQLGQT